MRWTNLADDPILNVVRRVRDIEGGAPVGFTDLSRGALNVLDEGALVAAIGTLPSGEKGIGITYQGSLASLSGIEAQHRSWIDGLNATVAPGGAIHEYIRITGEVANAAADSATGAHARIDATNNWVAQVSDVAWDGVNRAIAAQGTANAAASAAANAQTAANNAQSRADAAYGLASGKADSSTVSSLASTVSSLASTVSSLRAAYNGHSHNGNASGGPSHYAAP